MYCKHRGDAFKCTMLTLLFSSLTGITDPDNCIIASAQLKYNARRTAPRTVAKEDNIVTMYENKMVRFCLTSFKWYSSRLHHGTYANSQSHIYEPGRQS